MTEYSSNTPDVDMESTRERVAKVCPENCTAKLIVKVLFVIVNIIFLVCQITVTSLKVLMFFNDLSCVLALE